MTRNSVITIPPKVCANMWTKILNNLFNSCFALKHKRGPIGYTGIKTIRIDPLRTMNVCTKCNCNPFYGWLKTLTHLALVVVPPRGSFAG